jgi:hypothetical protein
MEMSPRCDELQMKKFLVSSLTKHLEKERHAENERYREREKEKERIWSDVVTEQKY